MSQSNTYPDSAEFTSILNRAADIVRGSEIEEDLRVSAFEAATRWLLSGTAQAEPVDPGGGEASGATSPLVGAVARRLGVSLAEASFVWADHDGGLVLTVPASKLEKSKSGATKQLALLVAAQALAAGSDEWVSMDDIRGVVQQYGRYDSPNFAKVFPALDVELQSVGKDSKRRFRLSRPGEETAAALVRKLAGSEGEGAQ